MEEYLQSSEVIDWAPPAIVELVGNLATQYETSMAISKACFEWVWDEVDLLPMLPAFLD